MLLLIERTRTHGEVTPARMEDTYVLEQMKLCMHTKEMKPRLHDERCKKFSYRRDGHKSRYPNAVNPWQ